jgi:hypothetical protein
MPDPLKGLFTLLLRNDRFTNYIMNYDVFLRFQGTHPEPRTGLQSGHIPHSINIPASHLMTSEKTFLEHADLKTLFEAANVDTNTNIITTCGMIAAISLILLLFTLYMYIRKRNNSVYFILRSRTFGCKECVRLRWFVD